MAMFGSQALETAIGLATLFFILATAASAICEVISRGFSKRSKDLERCIGSLLSGMDVKKAKDNGKKLKKASKERGTDGRKKPGDLDPDYQAALDAVKGTSVWLAAEAAAGKSLFRRRKSKGPSYLSAKAFANAVIEYISTATPPQGQPASASWPKNLEDRLKVMVAEGRDDLLEVKAGLEGWFDEAMGRAEGSYKRWATLVLFCIGFVLAGVGNVSAIGAAQGLWSDPVARSAVTQAAENYVADASTKPTQESVDSVDEATKLVARIGFPVGWDTKATAVWVETSTPKIFNSWSETGAQLWMVMGWTLTALLVMLGGPFWFDLLTRLVAMRGSGAKPEPAAKDEGSATSRVASSAREGVAGSLGKKRLDLSTGIVAAEPAAVSPAEPARDAGKTSTSTSRSGWKLEMKRL
ncbi:hypothetical protein [Intrasporangium mesophilum]